MKWAELTDTCSSDDGDWKLPVVGEQEAKTGTSCEHEAKLRTGDKIGNDKTHDEINDHEPAI